jgi:hypothetical protein
MQNAFGVQPTPNHSAGITEVEGMPTRTHLKQANEEMDRSGQRALSATVGEDLEPERPACIERVDFAAFFSGADDSGAGRHSQVVALDFIDLREFIRPGCNV